MMVASVNGRFCLSDIVGILKDDHCGLLVSTILIMIRPVSADHGVQLLLDPGLDLGIPHHVQHGPVEGCGGGLRPSQKEVK